MHEVVVLLKGAFRGMDSFRAWIVFPVSWMTRSRRDKLYIENAPWGPDADSVESGYWPPFSSIHVFISWVDRFEPSQITPSQPKWRAGFPPAPLVFSLASSTDLQSDA